MFKELVCGHASVCLTRKQTVTDANRSPTLAIDGFELAGLLDTNNTAWGSGQVTNERVYGPSTIADVYRSQKTDKAIQSEDLTSLIQFHTPQPGT